MYDMQVHLFII